MPSGACVDVNAIGLGTTVPGRHTEAMEFRDSLSQGEQKWRRGLTPHATWPSP